MWIVELLKAIFGFGTGVSKAIEARTKPAELQIKEHEEKKPKLSAIQFKGLYNDEFRRLKGHTEIDIATDVRFVNGALSEEDKAELIRLLEDRIAEYRKKFAWAVPKFRKWVRENNL